MHYAYVLIEHGEGRWKPGETLPATLPGLADLVEAGSAGELPYSRNLVVDARGMAIAEIVDGHEVPAQGIERYDGDFTAEQIADPEVDTPFLGRHIDAGDHRRQEPHLYSDADDNGKADA